MKKHIFLIIITFIGFVSQAQTWEDKVNSDPAYIKYKKEALVFYSSADYKKEVQIRSLYSEKMGKTLGENYTKNFEQWITENLSRTNFGTKEGAIKLYNERKEIIAKNQTLDKKIINEFNRLAEEYGYEKFSEFHNKELSAVLFPKKH